MTIQAAVQAAVDSVCPNTGVTFGRRDDKSTWRINFTPEATEEQRQAALDVVAAFDVQKCVEQERIDGEMAALEAAKPGYPRGVREKMLGDEARIDAVRALCESLPANDPAKGFATALLAVLPSFSSTPGMRNVKLLDDAIKAKRAQRP